MNYLELIKVQDAWLVHRRGCLVCGHRGEELCEVGAELAKEMIAGMPAEAFILGLSRRPVA